MKLLSVSDFPFEGVPVILGPLLYSEAEELSVEKLADTSAMPKTAVSIGVKSLFAMWQINGYLPLLYL